MSDNKKYYYLKLKENFFDSDEILYLESLPEGYKYSNILLKLYLRSLKNNGKLLMNEWIPYSPEMLSTVTRHSVGDIKQALVHFANLGLIEKMDNGTMFMLQIQDFIGKSSTEADRKRKYRNEIKQEKEKQKLIAGQMSDVRPPELELETELEISCYKEIQQLLKKYNIDDSSIINIIKTLQSVNKNIDYLQEKILVVKSKLSNKENTDIKSNIGLLINVIKNDWKVVNNNTKKSKFHNFAQVISNNYSNEELEKLIANKI
ncbi:phage replisome organizer N-terminal domain-containing protein [Peptostreptococcus canis]|uniref:Phage replisome organiser N-terminal domain-containing protein n=1 Tax=Peptostreptococcus canis TaxID=1159213 RepID=A0ABR6TMA9_9FIRM|nr:hypothetical protein [Peptostreptococcus canis]MBP1998741.1 putative phage replisome organizer [Peptostreptococcus canis]